MADEIRNSLFELIQNSGHLPNMENPEKFNTLLEEFYQRGEKPAANTVYKK